MAVIIRETRVLGGVPTEAVPVYKSLRPVTREAQEQAKKLDELLGARMADIEGEMKKLGLLDLKGKAGVLKLWYEAGQRLSFLDDVKQAVTPPEDFKYVWRALYDHAGELLPGPGKSRAERYENSHFKYCAQVARFDWEFAEAAGDWTSWVEFLDSASMRDDERIIDWLRVRSTEKPSGEWLEFMQGARQGWFRKLARAIRQRFRNRETEDILSDRELCGELDEVFAEVAEESRP